MIYHKNTDAAVFFAWSANDGGTTRFFSHCMRITEPGVALSAKVNDFSSVGIGANLCCQTTGQQAL